MVHQLLQYGFRVEPTVDGYRISWSVSRRKLRRQLPGLIVAMVWLISVLATVLRQGLGKFGAPWWFLGAFFLMPVALVCLLVMVRLRSEWLTIGYGGLTLDRGWGPLRWSHTVAVQDIQQVKLVSGAADRITGIIVETAARPLRFGDGLDEDALRALAEALVQTARSYGAEVPDETPVQGPATDSLAPAEEEAPVAIPAQPPSHRISVLDDSKGHLTIHLQPAPGAPIGCFAVAWIGFMTLFTFMFFLGILRAHDRPPPVIYIVLILFWGVGFGAVYAWIMQKFSRSVLSFRGLEARLEVKSPLGRRERTLILSPDTQVSRNAAYYVNGRPVYQVVIRSGGGRKLKLATAMDDEEHRFLIAKCREYIRNL